MTQTKADDRTLTLDRRYRLLKRNATVWLVRVGYFRIERDNSEKGIQPPRPSLK